MMMAAIDNGTRGRLRGATDGAHARVDACFARGLADAADYRRYLRGMHALLHAVEQAMSGAVLDAAWRGFRHPQRLAWIEADLQAVVATPLAPGPGLSIASDAEAAGTLYVVEGSALGATQLLLQAQALGWSATRGASFLHGHGGTGAGARWRRYVQCLESAALDAGGERAMMEAAARAFACAEHEFHRAERADELHA